MPSGGKDAAFIQVGRRIPCQHTHGSYQLLIILCVFHSCYTTMEAMKNYLGGGRTASLPKE